MCRIHINVLKIQDAIVMRDEDVRSDRHILVFRTKMKLKRTPKSGKCTISYRPTIFLRDKPKQNQFRIKLSNRFQTLEKITEYENVEEKWTIFKEAV